MISFSVNFFIDMYITFGKLKVNYTLTLNNLHIFHSDVFNLFLKKWIQICCYCFTKTPFQTALTTNYY